MTTFRPWLHRSMHLAVLSIFFMAAWWTPLIWSSDFMQAHFEFLIEIPAVIAIGLWLLLATPGLGYALGDWRRWWIAGMVALVLWARLSATWSLYPDDSLNAAQQLAVAALFALAVLCAGPSPRLVAIAFAMGIIFQTVIAVAQTRLQHSVGLSWFGEFGLTPNQSGVSVLLAGADRWLRPYGLTNHPNVLGGYCAAGLLVLSGWLSTSGNVARWRQVVRAVVVLIGLWCLALSFSRTAWGAFGVGILALVALWLRPRARRSGLLPSRRILTIAALGGTLLIVVFGLSYGKFVLARTGTTGDNTESRSISDRRYYTGIALQAIAERPFNGIGVGAFPSFATDVINDSPYSGWLIGDNVHNVPLLVFSELGVIGLLIWLFAWCTGLWLAWRKVYDPFAVGLVAAIVALLATGMLDHYIWSMFHFELVAWGGLSIALFSGLDRLDATAQPDSEQHQHEERAN